MASMRIFCCWRRGCCCLEQDPLARRSVSFNYPFLTSKERDVETGLDYFMARYYSSTLGRFTSIDPYNPILHSEDATDFVTYLSQPQNWNRYAYVLNNR